MGYYCVSHQTAKIWDSKTGCELNSFIHSDSVTSCAFSPDGKMILTGTSNGTIRLLTAEINNKSVKLDKIKCVKYNDLCALSYDGKKAIIVNYDMAKIIDRKGELIVNLTGHSDVIKISNFSPDGKWVVTVSDDQTGKIWDIFTGECLKTFQISIENNNFNCITISPDNNKLVFPENETLKILDVENFENNISLTGHLNNINFCSFSPDGKWVVTASDVSNSENLGFRDRKRANFV